MKVGDRITLDRLYELACLWCPLDARWDPLIAKRYTWGPAHEIGHALIEPTERWTMQNYGRCSTGTCSCPGEDCNVAERTAMLISTRLMTYAGRLDLVAKEIESTDSYDQIATPYYERKARRRLISLGLWPVPYTISRLTSAFSRRATLARQSVRRDSQTVLAPHPEARSAASRPRLAGAL